MKCSKEDDYDVNKSYLHNKLVFNVATNYEVEKIEFVTEVIFNFP